MQPSRHNELADQADLVDNVLASEQHTADGVGYTWKQQLVEREVLWDRSLADSSLSHSSHRSTSWCSHVWPSPRQKMCLVTS